MQNERIKVYQEGNTMKRSTLVLTALAVMLYLGGTVVFAQGGGHGSGAAGTHGNASLHSSTRGGDPGKRGPSTGGAKTASQLLQQNTKLESKLQTLLNKQLSGTGTTLTAAEVQQLAGKFKNMGQFVAAVHVSSNLGINFFGSGGLMDRMTGWTPSGSGGTFALTAPTGTPTLTSLGKSIQALDPNADPKSETKKANKQANDDIKGSKSES